MIVWSKLAHVLWYVSDIAINYILNKGLNHFTEHRLRGHAANNSASMPDIYGQQLLSVLMDEHDLRRRDLSDVFKSDTECFAVLSGQLPLTIDHIEMLANRFNVSPLVFFPEQSN